MLRVSSFIGLLLIVLALSSAVVGPVDAVTSYRFQLEPGTHEFEFDGHRMVIENRRALVVEIQSTEEVLQGYIEAANSSEASFVRIVQLGPPDIVIFDGAVTDPVPFSSSGSDETGHAEL